MPWWCRFKRMTPTACGSGGPKPTFSSSPIPYAESPMMLPTSPRRTRPSHLVYLIGALNPPEATPRDQIRIGAMLGALIQTPLCSPQGTEVVEEAVLFMMRSSG